MDDKIADAQAAIGMSTDAAQLALSYYYNDGMESQELKECFIILSVIGQISIDLAKKEFDIDVKKEIQRIKNLSFMKNKPIPKFYADNKKVRNNKDFGNKVEKLKCPMDIMAEIIDEKIIAYSARVYHEPVQKLFNRDILGSGNRYAKERFIDEAEQYNSAIGKLESFARENNISKDILYQLKSRQTNKFLQKIKKKMDQETVFQLVVNAFKDENSDIRMTILNMLYQTHKELLLNCFFVKNSQN